MEQQSTGTAKTAAVTGVMGTHRLQGMHLEGLLDPVAHNCEFCMVLGVLQQVIRQPEVPLNIPCKLIAVAMGQLLMHHLKFWSVIRACMSDSAHS